MINATTPRINPILATLEPATLPIAICIFPWKAATAATINSGKEVPKPTKIIPMTREGIFKCQANTTEAEIKRSAPKSNKPAPTMSSTTILKITLMFP